MITQFELNVTTAPWEEKVGFGSSRIIVLLFLFFGSVVLNQFELIFILSKIFIKFNFTFILEFV